MGILVYVPAYKKQKKLNDFNAIEDVSGQMEDFQHVGMGKQIKEPKK